MYYSQAPLPLPPKTLLDQPSYNVTFSQERGGLIKGILKSQYIVYTLDGCNMIDKTSPYAQIIVSDVGQVGDFPRVFRFLPPIKLIITI